MGLSLAQTLLNKGIFMSRKSAGSGVCQGESSRHYGWISTTPGAGASSSQEPSQMHRISSKLNPHPPMEKMDRDQDSGLWGSSSSSSSMSGGSWDQDWWSGGAGGCSDPYHHCDTPIYSPSSTKTSIKTYSRSIGGYGKVNAGYRKDDHLPVRVAIKRIPMSKVALTPLTWNDGDMVRVPLEVALMLRVTGPGGVVPGPSAVVSLLDWFQRGQELILVLERPVPCVDLFGFLQERGGRLREQDARVLLQQVLGALAELHSKGVVHRDVKTENILVETGSDPPRVRVIDLGCGSFLREDPYTEFSGTLEYSPPEWYVTGGYSAGQLTVWQVGVLLYVMVVGRFPFTTQAEIVCQEPHIHKGLTQNCQDLLRSCLSKCPEDRPSLETLPVHPWLACPTPGWSDPPLTGLIHPWLV
ncbi:unnamed protein product [Lota lota]